MLDLHKDHKTHSIEDSGRSGQISLKHERSLPKSFCAPRAADKDEFPHDSGMPQCTTLVLACKHLRGICWIHKCRVNVDITRRRRAVPKESEGNNVSMDLNTGELEWYSVGDRCLLDGLLGFFGIGSIELHGPIDDDLGRMDVTKAKQSLIVLLTLGEVGRGEAIFPAETVPIVDVLAKDNDVGVGNGLFAIEAGEYDICGRATRAAFRSEQFDKDWNRLGT